MKEEKTLRLTLKKKWYDMIDSGEKKEEYREDKPYWRKRLVIPGSHPPVTKDFDFVQFTNGYGSSRPRMMFECRVILLNFGNPNWGGDGKNIQFVIRLGNKVYSKP